MKEITILFAVALIGSLSLQAQNNPVIVELFTSQGCSSCPAADKNLTDILHQTETDGKHIYGLSFHVDYWNYIGWKDPYSNKAFTERQRKYGEELNLQSIYTPQMIVNGHDEFVGSSKGNLAKAIQQALQQKPVYLITIKDIHTINGTLQLQYTLNKQPSGEVINIAIVEKETENFVSRGENSGRKLHHNNVVRSFTTTSAKQDQKIQLPIPEMNLTKASVILYIQDKGMRIVGASAVPIN